MNKILLLGALIFSGSAFAQGIGPAGCGLGNIVMGGKDSQVLVATLNATGTQTFGITSGTSNCVDSSGTAKLEAFVEGNRVALETEAARGQGETVESLAQILRCPSSEKVGAALKASHSEVFSGSNAEVSVKVREALKNNEVLCVSQG